MRPSWRRIPIHLIALFVIAIAILVTHRHYVRRGLCFDDPSWFFHFGRKTLHGAVPYRDYVFQVGPLPIYVDAAFQSVFGELYRASLYASLAVKIVRVFIVWALVRRVADVRTACLFAVFCGIFPIFAIQHHWSAAYAELFVTLSGLFFVLAAGSDGRRTLVYLALAGMSCALIVSARQSSAIIATLALLACSSIMVVRREYFTARRFAALWGGYAVGLVLVFGLLACAGALSPASQQLFLDAAAKKGVSGLSSVLDAISGGALVDGQHSMWGGFLFWLGAPTLVVVAIVWGLARTEPVPPATVALLVIPGAILVSQLAQYASLSFTGDLPRMLLTTATAIAVFAPRRMRAWFGIEPVIAVGLCALPLASDWAFEMSYPGRGWGDATSLVTGALLFTFASTRLPTRAKVGLAGALAIAALSYFTAFAVWRVNPFAALDAADGTVLDNQRSVDSPILDGMRVNAARKATTEWLMREIRPGSTCFVYANMPVLYDITGCHNPTALDSTAGDFMAARDAEAAAAILRATPPDYIITHEQSWMNPLVTQDLNGKLENYGGMNPKASMAMHLGLRAIIDQYEDVGLAADILGPELARYASVQRDHHQAIRLYRRKALGSR